jgi:hypothetical protein
MIIMLWDMKPCSLLGILFFKPKGLFVCTYNDGNTGMAACGRGQNLQLFSWIWEKNQN